MPVLVIAQYVGQLRELPAQLLSGVALIHQQEGQRAHLRIRSPLIEQPDYTEDIFLFVFQRRPSNVLMDAIHSEESLGGMFLSPLEGHFPVSFL